MNRREGYHLAELTDHRGNQVTRAELAADERGGNTGWVALTARPVAVDVTLVAEVARLQAGAR